MEDSGTVGTDVHGSINGRAAFGYGNILRGAVGSPADGLAVRVAPGATEATVSFSGGFGSNMATMIDGYLRTSGLLSMREEAIQEGLRKVEEDREAVDRRSEAFRIRQAAQSPAMETIGRSPKGPG